MKIRIHGSIVDWVDRKQLPQDEEEKSLLEALQAQRRRRDGSFYVELTDDDALVVKTWASWIVFQMLPRKGNPGPERGLFNAATALVRTIDKVREEVAR